ncbi:MAG: L-fuculose-phosphate aldolase [Filifactor alocis]|nr:L-fuculose-phosphate aldolase [Filifactor alocis]
MTYQAQRQEVILFGNRLLQEGFTKGTGGNLSIFDRQNRKMLITPSGLAYQDIMEEDIVVMDIDGRVVEGSRIPSSEWEMHLMVYRHREDIDALIHAHTTYCTAVACLRKDLPAVHYMIAVAGENVRCADYATFGTRELAQNALVAMQDRRAVLLANHGVLAGGVNLKDAFNVLEEVEYTAQLYYLTSSMGDPVILDDSEMEVMKEKFKTYGQQR